MSNFHLQNSTSLALKEKKITYTYIYIYSFTGESPGRGVRENYYFSSAKKGKGQKLSKK